MMRSVLALALIATLVVAVSAEASARSHRSNRPSLETTPTPSPTPSESPSPRGGLTEIAEHDPDRFTPGAPGFLTKDEESSGVIPAPFLGRGWYLIDVQAHYTISGELVQGGQLLAMHIPPGKKLT